MGTCPGAIADRTRHRRSQQLADTHEIGSGRRSQTSLSGLWDRRDLGSLARDESCYLVFSAACFLSTTACGHAAPAQPGVEPGSPGNSRFPTKRISLRSHALVPVPSVWLKLVIRCRVELLGSRPTIFSANGFTDRREETRPKACSRARTDISPRRSSNWCDLSV